jgi:hypothetical protein
MILAAVYSRNAIGVHPVFCIRIFRGNCFYAVTYKSFDYLRHTDQLYRATHFLSRFRFFLSKTNINGSFRQKAA